MSMKQTVQHQDEINRLINEVGREIDSYKPLSQRAIAYCERYGTSLLDSNVTKGLLGVSTVAMLGLVGGIVATASHQLQVPPVMLQGALAVAAAAQVSAVAHFVGAYICKPFAKMMARDNFNADVEADNVMAGLKTVLDRNPHLSSEDRVKIVSESVSDFTHQRKEMLERSAPRYGVPRLEEQDRAALASCKNTVMGGMARMLNDLAQKDNHTVNALTTPKMQK
jgi:hypothetical protein